MIRSHAHKKLIWGFANTVFIVCTLFFSMGCSDPDIYISGDEYAIGAEVYIDGKKIGLMNEHVYIGSDRKDEIIVNREREMLKNLQLKKGQKSSGITIKLPKGVYDIQCVAKDGKKLETRLHVKGGPMYGSVDFTKMRINIE